MNNAAHVLEARNISKCFRDPLTVRVLHDVTFSVARNEFVAITGKSGCGKSTLLYILSTMDTDYEGELWIDGEAMKTKNERELARVRNEHIGFVFQFHYLLNELNVLKNVMVPAQKLARYSDSEIEDRAYAKLNLLGIGNEALRLPNQLSGGQKQRVAIARALINEPLIVMGDEPTGNLDKHNSDIVFNAFRELADSYGQSLLIVTHDNDFAARTDRVIEMSDGTIVIS